MSNIKVSIVMPSLNVRDYIEQCMDSVLAQTLKDIEVICVDAGSTDGTLEILEEYVKKDKRVSIINSDKKSYAYQMNLGFNAAQGEYFGIIETDDYAEPSMFEKLYNKAKEDDADVVKSGFFYYWSKPTERNEASPVASPSMCSKVFCPTTDFKSPLEQAEFFNIKPTIWSAIYKKDFIRDNNITFNETPGASYQDASFNFKVFAKAKRVRLVEDCYLHYRQDNENSSINSPGKVFCVCDEYEEMERFLKANPELSLEGVRLRLKYDSYIWNYERLSTELKLQFLPKASEEFKSDIEAGYVKPEYFPGYKYDTLHFIADDPMGYHEWREKNDNSPLPTSKPGETRIQQVIRLTKTVLKTIKANGFIYTAREIAIRIKRHF